MSLTAFLQQYIKPSRWWRRQRTIQVTVWPRWLAQILCPHARKQPVMWDIANKTKTDLCLDCYKHIEEVNDCIHGEVRVHSVEVAQLVPRSFLCEHCGVELGVKDLPTDARITNTMGSL